MARESQAWRRLLGVPAQGDAPGRQFDVDLPSVRGVSLALDQSHFLEQPQGRAHGLRLDAFGAGEVRSSRRSVLFQAAEDRLLCPGEFLQFRRRVGAMRRTSKPNAMAKSSTATSLLSERS